MIRLEMQELVHSHGQNEVIKNLSLKIEDGEFVSLLGPSGVGKSTILRAIAGLLAADSGKILLNGLQVNHLPPEKRDTVLMFQKPLLFPFLNVNDNITFGLKMAKIPKRIIKQRVEEMLCLVELNDFKDYRIHQLSGGQQQRVALARALVLKPSILLLDEPFSSLDTTLRAQMRQLLKDIQQQTGTTMLFVTHDQTEALSLSDRIALILDGTVRQLGTPKELFHAPADKDVALFFGNSNFIPPSMYCNLFPDQPYPDHPGEIEEGETCIAVIRPENIRLSSTPMANAVKGKIMSVQFEGVLTRMSLQTCYGRFSVLSIASHEDRSSELWLVFDRQDLHFF